MIFWFVAILIVGIVLVSMIGIFRARPSSSNAKPRRTLANSQLNERTNIFAESASTSAQEQQRHRSSKHHTHHSGSQGAEHRSHHHSGSWGAEQHSHHHNSLGGGGSHHGGGFHGGGHHG